MWWRSRSACLELFRRYVYASTQQSLLFGTMRKMARARRLQPKGSSATAADIAAEAAQWPRAAHPAAAIAEYCTNSWRSWHRHRYCHRHRQRHQRKRQTRLLALDVAAADSPRPRTPNTLRPLSRAEPPSPSLRSTGAVLGPAGHAPTTRPQYGTHTLCCGDRGDAAGLTPLLLHRPSTTATEGTVWRGNAQ